MATKTKAVDTLDPNRPASSGQTYALFCATKEDYRDKGLTWKQADDLLQKLNKKNGYKKKSKTSKLQTA